MSRVKSYMHVSGKKYDGMMGRCYRGSDASYDSYGGRGIRVCKEWLIDIESFRSWLRAEVANVGLSLEEFVANSRRYQLDRIDVNGHYTPTNCRLATIQENSRNKRTGRRVLISAEGEQVVV